MNRDMLSSKEYASPKSGFTHKEMLITFQVSLVVKSKSPHEIQICPVGDNILMTTRAIFYSFDKLHLPYSRDLLSKGNNIYIFIRNNNKKILNSESVVSARQNMIGICACTFISMRKLIFSSAPIHFSNFST